MGARVFLCVLLLGGGFCLVGCRCLFEAVGFFGVFFQFFSSFIFPGRAIVNFALPRGLAAGKRLDFRGSAAPGGRRGCPGTPCAGLPPASYHCNAQTTRGGGGGRRGATSFKPGAHR